MKGCIRLLLIILLWLSAFPAFSQQQQVSKIVTQIDSFANRIPTEKVFIQTDKPYYNSNDTIWMKAYVLDGGLSYSKQSTLLYIELINDTGTLVTRQVMPVKYGVSVGQMALDNKIVMEGSYTLRAYTNWMQNQGVESFFTKQLYITNAEAGSWLISGQNKLSNKEGKDNIEMALQFTDLNKNLVQLRELQVKIMNGDKTISRDNIQTDLTGKININFNLPDKVNAQKLTIVAQDMRKGEGNKTLLIPITLNRPENIDLQFMPVGGQLVGGLQSKIGFKAIGEDGNGANVKGVIVDDNNKEVASFEANHLGMGNFMLTPELNETYTAKIITANGTVKSYALPQIHTSGLVMAVNNVPGRDSLILIIQATPGLTADYILVGQSGDKIGYASQLNVNPQRNTIIGKIAKNKFASGLTRFTLFNSKQQPVAERVVFIDHNDALNISIKANSVYKLKDSVTLQLLVTDKNNQPIVGSFSLAVTDAAQVKADSTNVANIKTYMLLAGGLKGNIEQPGYYFNPNNTDRYEALDNLLLTQAWVGYSWSDIFNPAYTNKFRAEPEIAVTGQLSRVGGRSLAELPVVLLSTKKPRMVMDTVSDKNGRFIFRDLPRMDTAFFMVQVQDKKGKMFEANIDVDEFTPAKITGLTMPGLKPWYVNSDSTLLNYASQKIAENKFLDENYGTGKLLKAVEIKGRKIIKGSHFFAGYGAIPDLVLGEEDMKKANKKTIEQLLIEKVKGFGSNMLPCGSINQFLEFAIGCDQISFSIDGFFIDEFYQKNPGYRDHYEYVKRYIGLITAEDVRGIEVKSNYIEITTWSGNGAFMHRVSGRYLYRPPPITWPKEFYKPKYTTKINTLADLRATIHWEPNIITDKEGKATVSFYTKSKPGTYNVIVQGSDLNSAVGFDQTILTVVK